LLTKVEIKARYVTRLVAADLNFYKTIFNKNQFFLKFVMNHHIFKVMFDKFINLRRSVLKTLCSRNARVRNVTLFSKIGTKATFIALGIAALLVEEGKCV
jgi:hypothetical protein